MNKDFTTCAHCNVPFKDDEPSTRWISSGVLNIDVSTEENRHLTNAFHYGCLLILRQVNPVLLTLTEADFEADNYKVIKEHIEKMRAINVGVDIYESKI